MQILLNKSNSKKSVNVNNFITTNLIGSNKMFAHTDLYTTINEQNVYRNERSNCNIIRLNVVINPICSNVLFNNITEIVMNEGNPSSVKVLNYGADGFVEYSDFDGKIKCKPTSLYLDNGYKEAIRDTQITSQNCGYKYFCGIDIFNNHILRNNTFKTSCYSPSLNSSFNTINDYMRDENGANIQGEGYGGKILARQHLYNKEDVETFENTIDNKLREKNGWFGFTNIGKFNVVDNNNETMDIFRVINYRRSCDFIQMYPSSDLWSFTPKYNPYIHRLEKNWNYCLTYPSSSTTKNITFIREKNNGLKIMYLDDRVKLKNGLEAIKIYSISKHGLQKGNIINLYKNDDIILRKCEVKEVENDYIFYIYSGGFKIIDYWYELTKADTDTLGQDDFFVKRPIRLASYNLKYNGKKYTGQTITDSTKITVDVSGTWTTETYHGKYYNVVFGKANGRILSDSYASGTTFVSQNDIHWEIDDETNTISNVYVDMEMQYLISSDRERVFCGSGDVRMTYYLIDHKYVNIDDSAQDFSFKQVVDDEELEYYVRIFSRLPNWKGCDSIINQHQLYYAKPYLIHKYQTLDNDFENHISQLAFAKNIYGDDISQVVYTDDIDISYLRDNLGRPLTSIYFTILKNNKGYKEWYGKNGEDISIRKKSYMLEDDYHIEYSHCFGMLNCAFRLSKESMPHMGHNNSMQLNNIDSSFQYQGLDVEDIQLNTGIYKEFFDEEINDNEEWNRSFRSKYSSILNDEIQYGKYSEMTSKLEYKGDTNFYGDLCSYSKRRLNETSLQQIEMRFNTAQRELSQLDKSYKYFKKLYYDEIIYDDLDEKGFTSKEYEILNANQRREGYCYTPHYEIPIKTFSNSISEQKSISMTLVKLESFNFISPIDGDVNKNNVINDIRFKIKTLNNHNLQVNDTVYMKYTKYGINGVSVDSTYYYICYVTDIIDGKWFECCVYDEKHNRIYALDVINTLNYRLFKKDSTIPSYATFTKDGSCRFIWREILNNGFDDMSNNEKYPFFNGAFYVNKQINLFVKRQDPNEYTNLQNGQFPNDNLPLVKKINEDDNYYKENDITC